MSQRQVVRDLGCESHAPSLGRPTDKFGAAGARNSRSDGSDREPTFAPQCPGPKSLVSHSIR
ncbi:hypothetical protein NSERUTF1_2753 [Nocardia seriolae]|nr:hypothetical protein NSERUTF1_2753 [Nocardia seriolae]